MKRILSFVGCLIALSTSAQDLTGIWRGNFNAGGNRPFELPGQDSRYKFEVQIDQRNKAFSGVTYSYLTTVFYGKASCRGTVNPNTKKVLLEELKIVEVRMSNASSACIMTCFLQYSKIGEEEFLEGTYSSMSTADSTNCGKGTVFLRKVTSSDFYKEPFLIKREAEKEKQASQKPVITQKENTPPPATTKKVSPPPAKKPATGTGTAKKSVPSLTPPNNLVRKAPAPNPKTADKPVAKSTLPPPATTPKAVPVDTPQRVEIRVPTVPTPPVLATRENELVRTITTSAREILINIYDNGSIDNDTVSVYLDKKLVLSQKRLTEKPLTLKFELNEDTNFHELVMVAENLGEIPPNTSLMVVKAGNQQYEVRITSTEQKNAVVIFKYDKNR